MSEIKYTHKYYPPGLLSSSFQTKGKKVEDIDFVHLFEDEIKMKIPSEIKPN